MKLTYWDQLQSHLILTYVCHGYSSFLIRLCVCMSLRFSSLKLVYRDSNPEPFGLLVNTIPTSLITLMYLGFDSHYINCIIPTQPPPRQQDVGRMEDGLPLPSAHNRVWTMSNRGAGRRLRQRSRRHLDSLHHRRHRNSRFPDHAQRSCIPCSIGNSHHARRLFFSPRIRRSPRPDGRHISEPSPTVLKRETCQWSGARLEI